MAYTDISGRKLQSKMGAVLNESAASHSPALLSSRQSFAKRQLEKMGWTEGTGLGKNRDGRSEHVKIRQREDEMGLGREKELAREVGDVWWKDSLGGTLARLQQKKKKKKGDKKDKKKSKKRKDKDGEPAAAVKIYTDEELFEATGGARFGMRAQRRAEGKWKRTESGAELTELEEKARASMEWNGRGNAQALIEGTTKKKRKHATEEDVNTVSPSISEEERDADEDEKQSNSKRRKVEKSISEKEEEVASGDKESKKKKHKKKEKKKSKKSRKK